MKKKIRIVSMLLTVVLLMSAFVTPVAAGQGNGRGQERQSEQQIQYLDAEVRLIDGQPMLAVEGKEDYLFIPLELPKVASFTVDGQVKELEVKNNAVLVPTEDGIVAVPIEDFCVVMVDGEVMLLAEENPLFTIAFALLAAKYGAKVFGGKAAASQVGAIAGAIVDVAIINRLQR